MQAQHIQREKQDGWNVTEFRYNRWLSGRVRHSRPLPKPRNAVAAVVGTGPTVLEDARALNAMGVDVDWVGVNHVVNAVRLPWRHLVAIDPRGLVLFPNNGTPIHSVDEPGRDQCGASCLWRFTPRILRMGGPWAAVMCLALGYPRVVLCGCGMENNGHPPGVLGGRTNAYPDRWRCTHGRDITVNLGHAIRSMSGLTQRSFGAPDMTFLTAHLEEDKMVEVKMLVSMAGPDESYKPGDRRTVTESTADAWEKEGIAVRVPDGPAVVKKEAVIKKPPARKKIEPAIRLESVATPEPEPEPEPEPKPKKQTRKKRTAKRSKK